MGIKEGQIDVTPNASFPHIFLANITEAQQVLITMLCEVIDAYVYQVTDDGYVLTPLNNQEFLAAMRKDILECPCESCREVADEIMADIESEQAERVITVAEAEFTDLGISTKISGTVH